jgi:DNA-binding NarL/FixJ family response regulator
MDKVIRILVANRPKLMRELILETLADQPGIEIVGVVSDEAEIPGRVQQTRPDLLVIALDEPGKRPRVCDMVLRENPQVRIIAVAFEQNRSVGYWASFDIHSDDIEPSEAGILNAVRNMTARVGGVS